MRYVRIFLLTFQSVFEERGRSLVWFLLSCINPFIMMLFWRGANISSTTLSMITSYYFFLIIGGSIIMSHSEENIALIDIQEGRLANYLLKPFPYYSLKWLEELPYRALQGSFGLIVVALFSFLFQVKLSVGSQSVVNFLLIFLMLISAVTLAQLFKVCLGFISFWTTDAYGIFQLSEMFMFILGGYIAPLSFYPSVVASIAYFLPFPYMIYFPIASIAGFYTTQQLVFIFLGQLVWISIFVFLYKSLWKNGLKQFTGVGQ
ncbi:MAG TPA: ABC-2 family transporter protein [Patescibacteria group bacterium]|nr:ABC-2 family transporter protein [Patescibacteria group bacterium]